MRILRRFAICAASILMGAAVPAPAETVKVRVGKGTLGAKIPEDFIGFSLEIRNASERFFGNSAEPNTIFFQLMKNLKAGTIRAGGNSQDDLCWQDKAAAPKPAGCYGVLQLEDLKSFYTAAQATGWKVLWGLNLAQNSPDWAMKEVVDGVLAVSTPQHRLGIEIGNEPDRFRTRKFRTEDDNGPQIRDRSYSADDHVKDYKAYAEALRKNSATANVPLAGPGFSGGSTPQSDSGWREQNLANFIRKVTPRYLDLVTIHAYPVTRDNYYGRQAEIADILSPKVHEYWNPRIRKAIEAAKAAGLDLQMTETNSVNRGGAPGVSDTMASALWGMDWMFQFSQLGMRRISFHFGARSSSYNAIQSVARQRQGRWTYENEPQPLYYAMYLFREAAAGKSFLPVEVDGGDNVTVYAVAECPECPVNVFLLNKDTSQTPQVEVRLPKPGGQASTVILQAPSLTAKADQVTIGGQRFDGGTGRLPNPPERKSLASTEPGVYRVNLPIASIVVLSVQ